MITSRALSLPLLLLLALGGVTAGNPLTAADADWTPVPTHEVGAAWVVVDDYTLGSFAGGYQGGDGNQVTVTPERAGSAASLRVEYTLGDSGWAGLWHQVGMQWNQAQEWAGFQRLLLAVHTTTPITLVPQLQRDETQNIVLGAPVTTAGTGWEVLSLPRAMFTDLPEDLHEVRQINIGFNTPGTHTLRLGWIVVERDPTAVKDWVDLDAFAVVRQRPVPPTRGQQFHVDPNGDDEADGSASAPWRTIQRAVLDLHPGDEVLIRSGEYVEDHQPFFSAGDGLGAHQAGVLIRASGRPEAPIRIAAAPGATVTVRSATWATIRLQDSCHIIVEGLRVTTEPFPVEGTTTNVGNGISAERSHHLTLRGNTAFACGGGGLATMQCDYITIDRNTTYLNGFYMKWQGSGISLYQARDYDREPGYRNQVTRNISYRNENRVPDPSGKFTDGNGIIIDDFRNRQGAGPHIAYRGHTLVANNLCYDNGGRGIHVFLSDLVDVVHNTCVDNGRTLVDVADLSVWFATQVRVINNVASSRPQGIALQIEQARDVHVWSNLFAQGTVPAQWLSGNLRGDPLFIRHDVSDPDFRLHPGSPALGAADHTHRVADDLLGRPRPQDTAATLGAYER